MTERSRPDEINRLVREALKADHAAQLGPVSNRSDNLESAYRAGRALSNAVFAALRAQSERVRKNEPRNS
jgi:hypothetical protein